MEDLDIVLFKGKGFLGSYIIEWFTWSRFSHIGIVLKSPTYIDPKLTGTYLFESGLEYIKDAEDGKCKFGVQITPWNKIFEQYDGEIWKRSFKPDLDREKVENLLVKIHDVVHNKPYDDELFDLIRIELQEKWGDCQRDNKFVCSALVSFILVALKCLDTNTQWDLIEPKHFDAGKKIEQVIHNCELGDLVKIK